LQRHECPCSLRIGSHQLSWKIGSAGYAGEAGYELFELLLVRAFEGKIAGGAGILGILRDKLESDAIVAPADGAGLDGDGTALPELSAAGAGEGEADECAWIPALGGDQKEACGAEIADAVCLRSAPGEEVSVETWGGCSARLSAIRRVFGEETLEPTEGRRGDFANRLDEEGFVQRHLG
jgi:hypothetical protein